MKYKIMIYLKKNNTNRIVMSISKKPDRFLFRINNPLGIDRIIEIDDIGLYPERYNMFKLTEGQFEDIPNGIYNLDAGVYEYEVFEYNDSHEISSTDKALCSGYVTIIETISDYDNYDENNNYLNKLYYE